MDLKSILENTLREDYGLNVTIERSPLGQANESFLDAEKTIFVRLHRKEKQKESVELEERALHFLEQQGVKVPGIIQSTQGQLHLLVDGRILSVYNFVPHKPYSGLPGQLEEAARHHAVILNKLQGLDFPSEYWSNLLGFKSPGSEAWRDRLDHLLEDPNEGIRNRAQVLLGHYSKIVSIFPRETYRELPRINIHGDYHAFNIGFAQNDDQKIECVFDWEGIERRPIAYELMIALISFVRYQNKIDVEKVEELALRYLTNFFSASRDTEIGRMARDQTYLIAPLMMDRLFQFGINDLEMYASGRKEPFASCDRNIGLLNFLEDNPDFLQGIELK